MMRTSAKAEYAPARTDGNTDPEADDFATLFNRARTELKSGNTAGTIAESDALIDAYPDKPQLFMLKARALALENRLEDALQTLRSGLDRQPNDLKLLNMARNFALQTGGYQAAIHFARKLTELAPGDLKNRAFLVQYHLSSQAFDEALSGAQALLSDFPDEPLAWLLRTQVLIARQQFGPASDTVRDGLKLHSGNPKLLALGRHIALLQGKTEQAVAYALALSEVEPANHANRIFLATAGGDFEEILRCSDELIAENPSQARGWMIKADALIAQHKADEALAALRQALEVIGRDARLLGLARNVAFAHGHFSEALDYARELFVLDPLDRKNEAVLTRCWTAIGADDAISAHLNDAGPRVFEQPLRKAARNHREKERLKRTAPAILAAWREALDSTPNQSGRHDDAIVEATTIQYWSQGAPPPDVQVVISDWKHLMDRQQIGQVQLFDRASAENWIAENAPEFSTVFSKSFHYAMEADIFRIAYASKLPCIYADVDDWPLENTADIIKFCLRNRKSMLLFRSYKPWISNGFFISTPECPFFRELVAQALTIELDEWPKNRITIGKTFGPARYNQVLMELARRADSWTASQIEGLPGCSRLALDGHEMLFSHEAAVAALKPPFTLAYKATDAYWKKMPGKARRGLGPV